MGKGCEKCGRTLVPVYCWNSQQARTCSPTLQNAGSHITTHMHSPLCDVCKINPALIQCFTDGSSFCYNCFLGQHCVKSKHHVSIIPFSSHNHCFDALPQHLPAASSTQQGQSLMEEILQSIPPLSVPPCPPQQFGHFMIAKNAPFSKASSSGMLQNQPWQNAPFSIASSSQAYPGFVGLVSRDAEQIEPAARGVEAAGVVEAAAGDVAAAAGDVAAAGDAAGDVAAAGDAAGDVAAAGDDVQIDPDAVLDLFPLHPSKRQKRE